MQPKSSPLAVSLILLASFLTTGWSDPQVEKLKAEFEALFERRQSQKQSERRSLLEQIQSAARSPAGASSAYADAVRTVQFSGATGEAAQFAEWRKKHDSMLNSVPFRTVAQLHLNYLFLTMQRAGSDQPEDFVEPSFQYLKNLMDARHRQLDRQTDVPRQQTELLQQGVERGVFARAWRLEPFLAGIKNWEMAPGNIEGILNNNIRHFYREEKNPALLETWAWQIKLEEEQIRNVRSEHQRQIFQNERRPQLLFAKARDRAALGQIAGAVTESMGILRANPAHPDFEEWAAEIRKWLDDMAAPKEDAVAPTSSEENEEPSPHTPFSPDHSPQP